MYKVKKMMTGKVKLKSEAKGPARPYNKAYPDKFKRPELMGRGRRSYSKCCDNILVLT